ncbi:MAG: DUF4307 domain-containing protein [Actinomycetota bacterium]
MSELDLSDRYGIKPVRWKKTAIVLLLLGGPWLVWAGLHHSRPEISSDLISFSPNSDRSISIRYTVERRTPTQAITCTLVARDFDKNIVGQIDDVVKPGAAIVEITTQIPTRSAAVNAAISRCRANFPSSQ